MKFNAKPYQSDAAKFILSRLMSEGSAAFFADPGMGKTVVALSVIRALRRKGWGQALVVAPLRVATSTWPTEIKKWDHLRDLSIHVMHGQTKHVDTDADVLVINPEGLGWYETQEHRTDIVVFDESTKFKNWTAKRTKSARRIAKNTRGRLLLTGTPAPNGLLDLFSQVWLADLGATWGDAITPWKQRFFKSIDYNQWIWVPKDGTDRKLRSDIEPMTIRLDAKEYLDLPQVDHVTLNCRMPDEAHAKYKAIEKEFFTELEDGRIVHVTTTSGRYNTLRQASSGVFYDPDWDPTFHKSKAKPRRPTINLHRAKVDLLLDTIDELQGKQCLIAYEYRHEGDRLRQALGSATPVINGETSAKNSATIIDLWNKGEIRELLVQSSAVAHGLNLQYGDGDKALIWYTLTNLSLIHI